MVITTSEACTASVVRTLGACPEMSMPTSAMASTAEGFTWSPGMLPAERTSTCPPLRWVRKPAAIWDRPALCTQTNKTLGLSVIGVSAFRRESNGLSVLVQDLAEQGGDAGLDLSLIHISEPTRRTPISYAV